MIHVKYGLANGWSDGNCSKNCEHLKRHKNFNIMDVAMPGWARPGPVQAMAGDEYVWRPSSPGVCIYIMYYRVLYLHVDIYMTLFKVVANLVNYCVLGCPGGPLARCKNIIPLSLQFDWVDRVAFAARIDLLCYTIW